MAMIIDPFRQAVSGGGGCTAPNASFTGLAVTQLTTYGCYRKPILGVTSVSHSLADDTNLRFWVNCKLGNDSTSTFGAAACSSGGDLVAGKLFTYSQLQSGIDLLASDSTNAAAQDASDDIAIGWTIQVTAVDIADCPTSICADTSSYIQTLNPIESIPYDGPTVYTGTGTFPQFDSTGLASVTIGTGASYDNKINLEAALNHYANSASFGSDSFGATSYKIYIQHDTSCNTAGGCGSYSWTDSDDNGAYFAAGTGGTGQNFTVTEADCWDEDYIFVRFKIEAQGSCGTALADSWSGTYELNVSLEGVQCSGGGGGGGPP